ncbi:hypothetical protein [Rhodoplanes serenus]|uniref:hypothetical protein n=1 Tax=Rhodoplanes serenus TaxID=200615 RepID=UPI000DAE0555|nr:hypothetical protein [Rhodoplanes serenus]RAI34772.1 hypothetical protein CH340_07985 [Rhodoplanes serenus]
MVAYVDSNRLAWCGYPDGTAPLADCELIKQVTDAEHLEWLQAVAKVDGRRGIMARRALDEILIGRSESDAIARLVGGEECQDDPRRGMPEVRR